LLEQEFIRNQELLKPQDKNKEQERQSIEKMRGMPMPISTLEEIIDDDHAIVAPQSGLDYYVPMLSIVDRDQLEPGVQIM